MIGKPFAQFVNAAYPKGSIMQYFGEHPELYARYKMLWHNGIDLVAPWGTPIFAVADGKVCEASYNSGYGNVVRTINEEDEWTYGHLATIAVTAGQMVKAGDCIGTMGNCFDKETEILTNEGWKLFSQLNKKETVATLNPETQEIEYHKPTAYIKKNEKYIWKFRNYHSLDLAVTGNHTMYVELQDGKMHYRNFDDLPKYSWVKQAGGVWGGKEEEFFTIPTGTVGVNQSSARKQVLEVKISMDTWLAFLGWWITDGSASGWGVRITQSFNNAHKRLVIEDILDQLPFEVSSYKEDYIISSVYFVRFLQQLCPNKEIPPFIKDLSPRQIRIFLDGFWGGDGWQHKTTKYYITPLKSSADDLQELIMKCGGYAVIQKRDPLKINRTKPAMIGNQEVISTKPYYVITEGKHRMAMIKKDMAEKVLYDDFAYCITVPNHIIYVRRNGRPMWCGNTGFVVSGATPYWKANPYAGTHLHLGRRKYKPYKEGDTSWNISYTTGDKGTILNYENGTFGSINYELPNEVSKTSSPQPDINALQLTVISLANQAISLLKQLLAKKG